jgi:hypothetical protein
MKRRIFTSFWKMLLITSFSFVIWQSSIGQTNYYSYLGTGDVTQLGSWWTNPDGSGSPPPNFTNPGQVFNVQSGHAMTASATWTVSGAGSKVVIKTGGQITSGAFNHNFTLDMESGGTYIMTNTTYSNLTFGSLNSNSNFQLNDVTGFAVTRTYPNLIMNGTTNMSFGGNATINGNLVIKAMEVRGTAAAVARTHTIGGSIIINGGTFVGSNGAGNTIFNIGGSLLLQSGTYKASGAAGIPTLNFSGSSSTIDLTSAGSITNATHIININGTSTLLSNFPITTATNTFTVNGTIDCSTYQINGTGAFTLAAAATLITANTAGINGSIAVSGTQTFDNAANYQFNGTSGQVTGTNMKTTVNSLTINNSAGVTLSQATAITTSLTIGDVTSNSIFSDAGYQITCAGTLNMSNSGTFKLGAAAATTYPIFATNNFTTNCTVEYASDASQAVATIATAYPKLTFSGAGTKTTNPGALTTTGVWTVGSTTDLSANNTVVTIGGDITGAGSITQGAGLITVKGSWVQSGTFTASSAGVTLTAGVKGEKLINQIIGAAGLTFTTLTINNGPYANNNPGTLTVSTALSGSGSLNQSINATLEIGGVCDITGLNATAVPNSVNYMGTGQTLKVVPYYNLNLYGGAETFGAITTVAGDLYITGTASATTGANLAIGGNLTVVGALTTGDYTLDVTGLTGVSGGTLTLGGTAAKTFIGDVSVNAIGNWTETGIAAIYFAGNLDNSGNSFTALSGLHTFTGTGKTIGGFNTNLIANVAVTGTYTNDGVLNIGTALSGTGGLTNGISKTLYLGGTCTISSFTANAWDNTVNYNGNAQTVFPTAYYNLTLSGTGIPTLAGVTTIGNNFTLSGAVTTTTVTALNVANNLTIGVGNELDISPAGAITCTSGIITNSGTFKILANASGMGSFIGDPTSVVTANVQRYVDAGAVSNWEYVSSPISDATSDIFTSATHGLFWADEPNNAWVKILNGTSTPLNVMQGYARNYVLTDGDGNTTKLFTGTLNNGLLNIGLTRTDAAPGVNHGYNLVGNPYPSAMDWDAAAGWTLVNLDDAIYFRHDGTFGSYIAGVGTGTATNIIPPMQAFWVRASVDGAASLSCDNSVRVHNSQNIYKVNSDNTLHLTVSNNTNGLTDDTYIRFMATANDGFDSHYDAYKMFAADNAYPQVYTNNGTDDISINSLSELTGERIVALGFNTTLSGDFTITADLVSSFTDLGNTVYLVDMQTGAYQDLSINNTYLFTSSIESGLNRFLLHFNPETTGITENSENQVQIYTYNNEVRINSSNLIDGDANVYDLVGQLVASKHLSGTTSAVISMEPTSAVYIVKFTSSDNNITKRIFINQ